jgi:SNF2 family DNA or RNA helicase
MTAVPTVHKKLDLIHEDVEYYAHQVEGIRKLARMNNFLLADDMGLGKSLQAVTVAAIDFQMGHASKMLLVVPTSLKGNWEDELAEHTYFRPLVLDTLNKKKRSAVLAEFAECAPGTWNCLIVGYEQVISHLDELNAIGFDIVIYDEAHFIKNPSAKRTKASQGLHAKRHFLLTGSPMLGHVDDLWSLLYRIDPNMENYWRFRNRYCVFGGFKDKQVVGVKNRDELYARLQNVMVRRTKNEVGLGLPPKQRIPVRLDLSPLQQRLYNEMLEELRLEAPDPNVASPMEIENALTKFLRLKQICGTPATLEFEDPDLKYPDESTKLDWATEMAQEIVTEDQEHLVIFTQFRGVQRCMVERLEKAGIDTLQLHGGIPIEERMPVVRQWTAGGPSAIVCMLQVAGVGLNLTAARRAIFLDKLFVPKLNEQAEDRLHRIGASITQPVQIYELQMRKTIEQRVEQILRVKKELFDDVVETTSFRKKLYAALMEDD